MKILIAAAVLFTYGLQLFVPLEIIWTSMKHLFSHKYAAIGETFMRICIVMITGKRIALFRGEYVVSAVTTIKSE